MALVAAFAPCRPSLRFLALVSASSRASSSPTSNRRTRGERRRAELLGEAPGSRSHSHRNTSSSTSTASSPRPWLASRSSRHPGPFASSRFSQALASVSAQVKSLAEGTVVFTSTETWRTVYEQLLREAGALRSDRVCRLGQRPRRYWQDRPGRQKQCGSTSTSCKVAAGSSQFSILRGNLWPHEANSLPSPDIRPWDRAAARERHLGPPRPGVRHRGREPDLLADFGIYGDRATGVQGNSTSSRGLFGSRSSSFATRRVSASPGTGGSALLLYTTAYRDLRLDPDVRSFVRSDQPFLIPFGRGRRHPRAYRALSRHLAPSASPTEGARRGVARPRPPLGRRGWISRRR